MIAITQGGGSYRPLIVRRPSPNSAVALQAAGPFHVLAIGRALDVFICVFGMLSELGAAGAVSEKFSHGFTASMFALGAIGQAFDRRSSLSSIAQSAAIERENVVLQPAGLINIAISEIGESGAIAEAFKVGQAAESTAYAAGIIESPQRDYFLNRLGPSGSIEEC